MTIVKLFTMVKDEDDIIEDWVKYHGYLFGYKNLHIVDNYSTDNTYTILQKYESKGVNVYRNKYYKRKGKIMSHLMNQNRDETSFLYPIDSDEFIVLFNEDKNIIEVDRYTILNYFKKLPVHTSYKTPTITPKVSVLDPNRPCVTFEYASGPTFNSRYSKTFFRNINENVIRTDHGNHYFRGSNFKTNLCLVHYHYRGNLKKIKQKTYNNVKGLGYNPNNIKMLQELTERKGCAGMHHVKRQIQILQGTFSVGVNKSKTGISLQPFIYKLKSL